MKDNAKVSLYFLSELDLSDRWLLRYQDATIFLYSSNSSANPEVKYKFAIFNNQITQFPSSVSHICFYTNEDF